MSQPASVLPHRGWNANDAPQFGYQIVRPCCQVGVADLPEYFRVLVSALGYLIQAFSLLHYNTRLGGSLRNETHLLEPDHLPLGGGNAVRTDVFVSAAFKKHSSVLRLE